MLFQSCETATLLESVWFCRKMLCPSDVVNLDKVPTVDLILPQVQNCNFFLQYIAGLSPEPHMCHYRT